MPRRIPRSPMLPWLALVAGPALAATAPAGSPAVATASPFGGNASVTLEPVPASVVRSSTSRRLVFTCVEPGLVTFSDRPCGPWPQRRELAVTLAAPAPPQDDTHAADVPHGANPQASTRPSPDATAAARSSFETLPPERDLHAATCERLQAALRRLDQRMRAGYTSREAAQLWSRWREARERVREAGC